MADKENHLHARDSESNTPLQPQTGMVQNSRARQADDETTAIPTQPMSPFIDNGRGLQIQTNLVKGQPVLTVQSALQDALKRLQPSNDFRIILSSRTDKGVHSLKNACHVDLEYPEEGKEYDPDVITNVMNYGLESNLHDVRVLETRRVNYTFHARLSARERKYVYRLAHTVKQLKSDEEREAMVKELKKYFMPRHKHPRIPIRDTLPVTDMYRVKTFRDMLDISKLVSAAEACSGIHDYSSFTRPIKYPDFQPNPIKMLSIGVKRGQPFAQPMNALSHKVTEDLEYWDIHVRSRSFLYRQVRRLVGGMVLVARNRITVEDLKDILDNPRVNFPFAGQMSMDESGLFLVDVVYDSDDLKFDETSCEKTSKDVSSSMPPVTDLDLCNDYVESSREDDDTTTAFTNGSSIKFCDSHRGDASRNTNANEKMEQVIQTVR